MSACENCDGRRCMSCVLREIHGSCIDDCPSCCPPPQPALTRLAAEADDADARWREWMERALRAEAQVAAKDEAIGELLGLIFPRCAECLEAIEPTEIAVRAEERHNGRPVHVECP